MTKYHAKYFAHELTRTGGQGLDRISQSLFNASVDLNPHQVEAALFALSNPLSKGAILADEVGLGKTIEAGLILCQYWAERKRQLIIICPAALRKQWQLELQEKFNIPSRIADAKQNRIAQKEGFLNIFECPEVIITSYHYASRMADELRQKHWDLAVIDEAHKLRNSYRHSNKMGQNLRFALEETKKVLLTATPLQNSLAELYGLATLIDDQIFGDLPSFRSLYMNNGCDMADLQNRLSAFCKRTLRKDVLEFIKYTERKTLTMKFRPTDDEHRFYEEISSYLQDEESYAFPAEQSHLITLIVRKVLASSPVALAGTLGVIKERLIALQADAKDCRDITERILDEDDLDEDLLEELLDEMEGEESVDLFEDEKTIDPKKLAAEIERLDRLILWARSLGIDTKTKHLLKAIDSGYEELAGMGAQEKAVIFTESRRTQEYLKGFLENNGHAGEVLCFNGTMKDQESKDLYQRWLTENSNTGRVTGSPAVDKRQAIIDEFRGPAKILIATEAAAEGINLQFCSLLINFDLPWNPQRVEQRIGRCHRYGQKHDVVVINFLNEKNEADRRVYELLSLKFKLFEGVFGASDEILGKLDNSASFEARIHDLYQQCRTPEEIEAGFKALQEELDGQIQFKMQETKEQLLEHFDEDVHAKLKVDYDEAKQKLDDVGKMFWRLSQYMLYGKANFNEENLSFDLTQSPILEAHNGFYQMIRHDQKAKEGELYRMSHPLGEHVIVEGQKLLIQSGHAEFDLSQYQAKVSVLEKYKGQQGWLILNKLKIESYAKEEYLLFTGISDDGESLDQETLAKLFKLEAKEMPAINPPENVMDSLHANAEQLEQATIKKSLEKNNVSFQERREQLYRWADDSVARAEDELKQTKQQIRRLENESRKCENLSEQKPLLEEIKNLEKKKKRQRREIFDLEDEIAEKRDTLIETLEKQMIQQTDKETLFILRWRIV